MCRYIENVFTTGGSPTDAVIWWIGAPLLAGVCIVVLSAMTEWVIHALQALGAWWQGASTLFLR